MTDGNGEFVRMPEPTTYKAKIKLNLNQSDRIEDIVIHYEKIFANEFELGENNVNLLEMNVKPKRTDDYIYIRFGSMRNDDGLDGLEDRIEDLVADATNNEKEKVNASIIDTLP